jgi:spore coat protein U-like protein
MLQQHSLHYVQSTSIKCNRHRPFDINLDISQARSSLKKRVMSLKTFLNISSSFVVAARVKHWRTFATPQ